MFKVPNEAQIDDTGIGIDMDIGDQRDALDSSAQGEGK